jgi:two-component system cell cycle sensor histidine kinase/response regulator CckA
LTSELIEAKYSLDALNKLTQDAVLILRPDDGQVISANGGFLRMFGLSRDDLWYSRMKAALVESFVDSAEFESAWAQRGLGIERERVWKAKVRGQVRWVKIQSKVISEGVDRELLLWDFRDVSDVMGLKQALERSQRMESIGRLAGGVAHDFNNMLTGIIGNLSLAELSGSGEKMTVSDLELISSARKAGLRAADLVKRLLDYSRNGDAKFLSVDVNELLGDTHDLLHNSFDQAIHFSIDLAEDIWTVNADMTQLQQVLLNLCMNARDALEHGGEIRMSSRNVSASEAVTLKGLDEADYVCVSVADNGVGISPDVIGKIFDPYFTTKEPGADSGTGIGLAVTGEIVRNHGGHISCESVIGMGTVFNVYLRKDTTEASAAEEVSVTGRNGFEGTETILLVDDEEMVRKVGEGMLKKMGYRVLLAKDGEEAVEVFDQMKDQIHIILLDLTMPKLSGRAAFGMIKERSIGMPVLLCSGYPVDLDDFAEETGYRPDGALQKPFSVEMLCGSIREILDAHYGLVLSSSE